ncbi:MAG: hypothetical protein PHW40_07270 [Candidatus Izemoplasmatales bacterium]|nr:hypothetical protein [Candidatus Izemoplasmatales bacterium]
MNEIYKFYLNELQTAKDNGFTRGECKRLSIDAVYQRFSEITPDYLYRPESSKFKSKLALANMKVFPEFDKRLLKRKLDEKTKQVELNNSEPFARIFMRLIDKNIEIPPNKFWEAFYDKQFNIASYFSYVKDGYDRQKTESGGYIFTKNNNGKIAQLEEEYNELVKEFNQAGLNGNMPKVFQLVNKMEEVKKQIAKLNG